MGKIEIPHKSHKSSCTRKFAVLYISKDSIPVDSDTLAWGDPSHHILDTKCLWHTVFMPSTHMFWISTIQNPNLFQVTWIPIKRLA